MDTDTLVVDRIEDGGKLIDRIAGDGFDVTAACWVKTSETEEGRWFLYIASNEVDRRGSAAAYRDAYRALESIPDTLISMSEIKLVGLDHPIAKDVLEIGRRFPAKLPARLRMPRFGNIAVEEVYIYSMPVISFRGFNDIKRRFPSAELFAIAVPNTGMDLLHRVTPYVGKINAAEFEGKAPGTVWFGGPHSDTGSIKASLVFVHRPEGWNTLYREDTKTWEEVVHLATGKKLYEEVDFSPLAAMKISD